MHVGNVEEFMRGTEQLDTMISRLNEEHSIERLKYIIDNCVVE